MWDENAKFTDGPLGKISSASDAFERLRTVCRLPCGGELLFMTEDPVLAEEFRSVSGNDYKPARDINRYVVCCQFKNLDSHKCPWWNAFREAFSGWKLRGFKVASGTFEVKQDSVDADANAPWIGYRDGSAGPVLAQYGFELDMPKDIEKVAAECERAAYAAQYPENRGEDVDGVHGDSIPFFKRLFGKGEKTC